MMKAMFLGAALLMVPATASAQGRNKLESPQNFALELRFGPHYPKVDDEPALAGQTPFKNVFGDNARFMVGLEVDWQALRIPHFGTLGPGVSVGYTKFGGTSKVSGTKIDSAQATNLEIYPFSGVGVLRVDVLANELRFPIVPYLKAGLGVGLWRAYGPSGTEYSSTAQGKGMSWGTHWALGAALQLDFLDRGSVGALDEASGINHTYVFFEYFSSSLDNFGGTKAMHVGANTWSAGLAFEF